MTGNTSTDLETLKKRLNEQQRAIKLLEQQGKSDSLLYQHLLAKLALACRGQNLELDNKLAQLRAQLADNADLSKSAKLLETVETLLSQNAQHAEQQLVSTREAITGAGKQLQKVRGLDPQVRRELRELLTEVEDTPQNVLHYLPHLEQLSGLYQQALLAATKERDALQMAQAKQQSPIAPAAPSPQVASLQREMADTILTLLGEIEFDQQTATELSALRRELALAGSAEQLLGYCTELLQMIINGIKRERALSASFLASLNDTLATVHNAVNRSLNQSEYLSEESRQFNQSLRQSIANLSSDVSKATDLNSLRNGISSQLGLILEAIEQREQLNVTEVEINQLLADLRHQVSSLESETEHYRSQLAEQRQQLLIDPLTQLPNRSAFDERFEIEFSRFARYNGPLALAIIDIDLFKRINDTYGHSAGDKTLHVLGQVFAKSFRRCDVVARYGGEEFIVLLPELKPQDLKRPLEKLRQTVMRLPFDFKGEKITITISVGATNFVAGDTPTTAFERADAALYQAKAAGRNQVRIST